MKRRRSGRTPGRPHGPGNRRPTAAHPWRRRFLCLLLTAALAPRSVRARDPAAGVEPPPAATVRVMFYNLRNYFSDAAHLAKPAAARAAVTNMIRDGNPDILVVCEVGGDEALKTLHTDLLARGLRYPFWTSVTGGDSIRRLVLFSRTAPLAVLHDVYSTYPIGKIPDQPVRRGFIYCIFRFPGGYVLHLLGAHLKSKVFHRLGQSDMRRYEARLLRYLVTDILRVQPGANVLVLGDMNDAPNSSPILAIVNNRFKKGKRLFDLRPADTRQETWTHMWASEDVYSRYDYAFSSFGLLPEIVFDATRIIDSSDWLVASDHRPVLVTVTAAEQQNPGVTELFTHSVRRRPRSGDTRLQERIIGTRKARRAGERR